MVNDKLEKSMTALLNEYQAALKWTRDKLEEKEEECDRLRLIILHMTNKEGEKPDAYDP